MTQTQETTALTMMKTDLGIMATTTAYDTRFTQILNSSEQMIREQGANLDLDSAEDLQLLVMYATWTWRRRDTGDGMPRMLRYALNNRILKEKAHG